MTFAPVSTVLLSREAQSPLETSETYSLHRLPTPALATLRRRWSEDGPVEVGEVAQAVSIGIASLGSGDGNSRGHPPATGSCIPCAERDPPPGQTPRKLPSEKAES